jgi:hypothetical protein
MSQYYGCNIFIKPLERGGFEFGAEQNGLLVACGFSFSAQNEDEIRLLAQLAIAKNFQTPLNRSPGAKTKKRTKNPGRS